MPQRILIVQSDTTSSQTLAQFFSSRGDKVWQVADSAAAIQHLEQVKPDLMLVDLHLVGNTWLDVIRETRRQVPPTPVIVTSKHPDFQRELLAREQHVEVFLREPFDPRWIQRALKRIEIITKAGKKGATAGLPSVRFPVRIKITLPYLFLALIFAMVGAYIVTQFVLGQVEERFNNQLIATGKQNADWMVREESKHLETLRLVANTQGIAGAISQVDDKTLHEIALAHAINSNEELIDILDPHGASVLSLHHVPGGKAEDYTVTKGDTVFAGLPFVREVLAGKQDNGQDKTAGLAAPSWGPSFYVCGPILDTQGKIAGAVLVGRSLSSMVAQIRQDDLADVTVYDAGGRPVTSTLATGAAGVTPLSTLNASSLLSGQEQTSLVRDMTLASNQYSEIIGPWEARNGEDLGLMGTSLPRYFLQTTGQVTRSEVFILVALMLLLVVAVGITLANQITRPLVRIVRASAEVAKGNLDVKVDPRGNDEVAVLAHTFNSMIAGLQEGSMYRDLLGRTVSPEVREQLRQTFTSGHLRLEGQEAVATVMMSDIRGFTSLSEKADPATVFRWLNEYFGELVPIITASSGVVNKFDGDAMLAFFGILPKILNPKQSAYCACQGALEILAAIERLNFQRVERGDPPLSTGIGVNTGMVTAGGLGTSDRVHYTIIGDTVNTTQRLESLTRQLFNVSGALISESTYQALGEYRSRFRLDPLGLYVVKGKTEQVSVYRLLPLAEGAAGVETVASGSGNSVDLTAAQAPRMVSRSQAVTGPLKEPGV
jgi:class 3 adenylate cyclase/CheY-like chemotaxis protein